MSVVIVNIDCCIFLKISRLVYRGTALCHVGDFRGGDCLIYLSVTTITVCAPNGKTIGTWPYNAIRDFSCRDGNFSFTSGRRGPFGVGAYLFQLTPPVLTKLTSAVTIITGAQFGQNASHQQSHSPTTTQPGNASQEPQGPTTCEFSPTLIQQHQISSPGHPNTSIIFETNSFLCSPTDNTCVQLKKTLHNSCSLPDLNSPRTSQSHHPDLFKKQLSVPEPLRQRKRAHHYYEEIDLPDSAGSHPSTIISTHTAPSPDEEVAPIVPLPVPVSSTTGIVPAVAPLSCSPKAIVGQNCAPSDGTQGTLYENIPSRSSGCTRCEEGPTAQTDGSVGCLGIRHQGSSCMHKQATQSKAESIYDSPHHSLYSVPTSHSGGEMLTLNARRVRTHAHSRENTATDSTYCNVQSSMTRGMRRCALSEVARNDDQYEEMCRTGAHPRHSHAQLQGASLDTLSSGCRSTYSTGASLIARQLAIEEGYELLTSGEQAGCKHDWSQSDIEGPEKLYVNQQLCKETDDANHAADKEESGSCVAARSQDTISGAHLLARGVQSMYQVPKLHSTSRCMCLEPLKKSDSNPISVLTL